MVFRSDPQSQSSLQPTTMVNDEWAMMSVTNVNLHKFNSGCVTFAHKRKKNYFWEEPVRRILEEVKKKDGRFKLEIIHTGSYYDKSKVIEPNEFDLMLEMTELKLSRDDQYDSDEDNLAFDPPIGYTTVMIDEGEETEWRKRGCIGRGENLLKATKVKGLFAGYIREAFPTLDIIECGDLRARSHGPAVTLIVPDLDLYKTCAIDLTLAIKDESWPEDADEWPKRARGWPPRHLVDAIVRDGCHLVGKRPRFSSSTPESEYLWRYSFSTAEMKLLSHLEPCWIKVLRILKALREYKYLNLDPLTSYHLKTIMLYEREENPDPAMWTEDRLNVRFRGALDKILWCLNNKRCPHYFIRDVNLFDDRFDKHYKDLIIRTTEMKNDPNTILEEVMRRTPC